jgi:RNA polymerase sigma factor for flagellar operon FliA
VAAERLGYLRDAIAELPDRARLVVTGYYLEDRQLTDIAEELGVTQSRASQLRSEGLDLLKEALSRLLEDDAKAGRGANADGDGVRARRRDAYVSAVARRSDVRTRADVQAYLDGSPVMGHARG